jgi:hypothetical protein
MPISVSSYKPIPLFITCHLTAIIIGTFLLNNYKQALALLETKPAVESALRKVGAGDELVVVNWLKEEEEYLRGLSKEPLLETLEMEYYKLLVTLADSEYVFFYSQGTYLLPCDRRKLAASLATWSNLTEATIGKRDMTASAETAHRHALESNKHDLVAVQILECKLNIAQRWTLDSVEWQQAAEKVSMRRYQRCIDALEGLVVARMFELTKMNMSQTGKPHILSV